MRKIPVITIGYRAFALPTNAPVAAIMKTLAQAQEVSCTYHDGKHLYFPVADSRQSDMKLEYVDSRNFRAADPQAEPNVDVAPAPRRKALPGQSTLLLKGGA